MLRSRIHRIRRILLVLVLVTLVLAAVIAVPTLVKTGDSSSVLQQGCLPCPQETVCAYVYFPEQNGNGCNTASPAQNSVVLAGAGATLPAPLLRRWFSDYRRQNPLVFLSYQAIGSGAGIKHFIAQTVDFAATDIVMTDAQIAQVNRGVLLLPITAWGIAIGYNLDEVKNLKLSQTVLADIFLGKITRWNHPAIAKINPDMALPDIPIVPIYRRDGSNTTLVLTRYLSAISPEWRRRVGLGLTVNWVTGVRAVGGTIFSDLLRTRGGISYFEMSVAEMNGLSTATLQNRSGHYVSPTITAAMKTLEAVELPEDFRVAIVNPSGKDVYPMVGYSWLLAHKTYPARKGQALKDFLKWSLTEGQALSSQLGYVPLPTPIARKVLAAVDRIH